MLREGIYTEKNVLMRKVKGFHEFRFIKDLSKPVSESQIERVNELLSESSLNIDVNEGFLDDIKTGLSKFFLGDLSGASIIDKLRSAILEAEIEYDEESAELADQIEKLKEEPGTDKKSIEKEIDLKNKAMEELTKGFKIRKRKLMDEVERVIGGSKRLREYFEAGRAQDEYRLAQMRYEEAKKRADDQEKIRKAKAELEAAKKEAEAAKEELEKDMKGKRGDSGEDGESGEGGTKGPEGPSGPEGGEDDPSKGPSSPTSMTPVTTEEEKKVVSSKKASTIIDRKKELRKEIADLKAELESILESFYKKINRSPEKVNKQMIDKVQAKALEVSTYLDSRENLLDEYIRMGSSEREIQKSLSSLSKISSNINKAIASGSDVNTGSKKMIADAFKGKVTASKIKGLINDINSL
jgi:DNA repair exonuclease SbcCD ATPase subunit